MKLNHPQGQAAEELAWAFLKAQGCRLIARNWHCRHGEIDLIVLHNGVLVFVEVKYRRNTRFGGSAYSISPAKLAKLQRSIETYLQQHGNRPCRLDAVLIEGTAEPNWIQNLTG